MSYTIISRTDEMSWVKFSGLLTVHDFLELQALGKKSLELFGCFRTLVELEDFHGWSKEPGWENTAFLMDTGWRRTKIAFVGDDKWRDDMFMFTGKPFRSAAIEFFPTARLAEAQAWLAKED
ncbi:MAG: STAS/SEC14 domain-containing protein [Gammaproteobacteria bacterium]